MNTFRAHLRAKQRARIVMKRTVSFAAPSDTE
jgi:hypothetical protein